MGGRGGSSDSKCGSWPFICRVAQGRAARPSLATHPRRGGRWRRGSARRRSRTPQTGAALPRPACSSAQTSSRCGPTPPACGRSGRTGREWRSGARELGWQPEVHAHQRQPVEERPQLLRAHLRYSPGRQPYVFKEKSMSCFRGSDGSVVGWARLRAPMHHCTSSSERQHSHQHQHLHQHLHPHQHQHVPAGSPQGACAGARGGTGAPGGRLR